MANFRLMLISSLFLQTKSFSATNQVARRLLSSQRTKSTLSSNNSILSFYKVAASVSTLSSSSLTSTTTRLNMSSSASIDIADNLKYVNDRVAKCVEECNRPEGSVKLVAVSKTKPAELLMEAYDAGQRYFGENYAQELISKASTLPSDIKWHFIGPLQSNKAASLVKSVGLDKLACVETVSTIKLANKLNNAVNSLLESTSQEGSSEENKLGIYIQINTSGEESKSGIQSSEELKTLVDGITSNCPHLKVLGLMTIGAPGDYSCFDKLVEMRETAATLLELDSAEELVLSMGMSGDFEEAIKRGSTSVRVGSTIFGARDYSNKK
jgi:pyridoxal phosphate enzyme (YggS family)